MFKLLFRRAYLFLIIFFFLNISFAHASYIKPPAPKPVPIGPIIKLNVKVTNWNTGKPLRGAKVELDVLYVAFGAKASGFTDKDGNVILIIASHPKGTGYLLNNLYFLKASYKNYSVRVWQDRLRDMQAVSLPLKPLDQTPPQGTIKINNDAVYARSTSVGLTLNAKDSTDNNGSGVVTQVRFSEDNKSWSAPKASRQNYYMAWKLSSGDGPKTVYAKFMDAVGNWSLPVSDSIILDATPPVINITYPPDSFLTNQKAITVKYTVDGTAKSEERALTEGQNILTASASDQAGNNATASVKVTLDATAPVKPIVTDSGEETVSTNKLSASWTSSDSGSGIVEYQYKITQDSQAGPVILDWTAVGLVTGITKTELYLILGKTYYFSVRAKDAAGSWSEAGLSDGIKIISSGNTSPKITNILPQDKSEFLAGTAIIIRVAASDLDNDSLEYQFSIGGTVKQSWSSLNIYSWATSVSDAGAVSVICEVRDSNGASVSQSLAYSIINLSVEEVLQKVSSNYELIDDQKANMSVSTILDLQPLGEAEYYIYYFKKPKKEKIETYLSSDRVNKTDITIIDGSVMYLVDPVTGESQSVDLLAKSNIDSAQFNRMDIYYNLPEFLAGHAVTKNEGDSDLINYIIAIDALPKTVNPLYEKLELFIDYKKGLLVKSLLFKDGSLREKMEVQESQVMSNGAWLPVKMVKTPMLTSGNMVNTLTYSDIQINVGLKDEDFDPAKQ